MSTRKTREYVSEALWSVIAPLLPPEPPKPKGGRPPIPNRRCLNGLIFVLRTGCPWEHVPQAAGWGSGMTLWRRLRDWQAAGVWAQVQQVLLDWLGQTETLDWHRVSLDCASVPAPAGGAATGPNPTDRGKAGTKHHVLVERHGLPLAVHQTGANRQESTQFDHMLDAVPPIATKRGGRRRRPRKLHADKAYDFPRCRESLRRRHILPRIARRGIESATRLGRHRWVAERTLAWLHRFRRLRIRYERRDDIHFAFLLLGAILICWQTVERVGGIC